ncbi:MAG: hypothetical protein JWQ81_6047 [Amycolatopsis sp.]|uniref:hypothetical protein n=1 Tax=Amycolatopsis sp. TaxID=37632 RepID=UPI0026279A35|nr:hypothetical protein [Amycolatopsis sp.]MCU1685308.1 hypothetical protein [Amycolatopsis sp.]
MKNRTATLTRPKPRPVSTRPAPRPTSPPRPRPTIIDQLERVCYCRSCGSADNPRAAYWARKFEAAERDLYSAAGEPMPEPTCPRVAATDDVRREQTAKKRAADTRTLDEVADSMLSLLDDAGLEQFLDGDAA